MLLRCACAVFATFWGVYAGADDLMGFSDIETGEQSWLNQSGNARLGYWNSTRDLDDENNLGSGSLLFSAEPEIGDWGVGKFEARLDTDSLNDDSAQFRINEFYIESSFDFLDISIGRQIEVWGRADKLNPTDKISPRDYTLLASEDTEQRLGTFMIKSVYYFDELSLTALWLPEFKPNEVPLKEHSQVTIKQHEVKSQRSWAMKLDRSGGSIDWSVSYFDGFNVTADIGLEALEGQQALVSMRYLPLRLLGADIATTAGNYGLRAEMAYAHTSDDNGDIPFVMNRYAELVLGIDRTFYEYLNINLQLFTHHVFDYQSPTNLTHPIEQLVAKQGAIVAKQLDQDTHGLTVRISDRWLDTALQAELSAVYRWPREDYVLRAKVKYRFTDHFSGVVGADWLRGPDDSYYGYLRDNSLAFVEVKYSF
ncbi:DUF1302 family protein [Aliikangiella sp. IMCC44359]|uniref:DUF1302 family protein n=1 Tax=Aliikangiella sp. IMCC44359 TaxID=3459125 RepID=UPI00403AA3BC